MEVRIGGCGVVACHENVKSGTSPWVLMDFRSPTRLLPGVQDYHNRKGLISDQGQRKLAFYTLQKFYKKLADAEK